MLSALVFAAGCAAPPAGDGGTERILPETDGFSVDINSAEISEIERLPGIGPGTAARIVDFRKRHGRFRRPEHLLLVPGISDRKFREIRTRITAD